MQWLLLRTPRRVCQYFRILVLGETLKVCLFHARIDSRAFSRLINQPAGAFSVLGQFPEEVIGF